MADIFPSWLDGLTNINIQQIVDVLTNIQSVKQVDVVGFITILLAIVNIVLAMAWYLEIKARKRRM